MHHLFIIVFMFTSFVKMTRTEAFKYILTNITMLMPHPTQPISLPHHLKSGRATPVTVILEECVCAVEALCISKKARAYPPVLAASWEQYSPG